MTDTVDPLRVRLHAAARWEDDSDWHGVRRLARRRAAPVALAVVVAAAVVLAAPALAFRHQIAGWFASPETNHYPWASAACGQAPFSLRFDPSAGATVVAGGKTLATASLDDRQITCAGPIVQHTTTPDESPYTEAGIDRDRASATTVACTGDTPLEVEVNPIYEGDSIVGSSLLVAQRDTKAIIASAWFKRDPSDGRIWRKVYWSSKACRPS